MAPWNTPPQRTWATSTELLLGLDIGSSRMKAVLVDAEGHDAGVANVTTPFVTSGGRVEMEVDAFRRRLGEVLGALGDARRSVVAVGVAGMAESGAPLDASRRPLAPIIAWHDGRGGETVRRLEREVGPELAHRIGQPVRTVLTAAKLGWLLDHGVCGVQRWLGVPELILHALTGEEATEFSLAARTGCYDVATRHWIPAVADVLGVTHDLFPPVSPAGSAMGRVSRHGASWSGLSSGLPVTIGGHDHLAGMAGAGVRRREMANSVGTAETIVGRSETLPDLATAARLRVAVTVHPGGEEWATLVSAARAGLVLEAAAGALGRSPQDLDELADGASAVDADELVDALARGDAVHLPDAAPGEIWAGLLHALTRRTLDSYQRLAQVLGPAERLVVFGGGSVSAPWLGAKAAALPVPVRRSTTSSAVARGAAVYAGVAAGWWPSADEAPTPGG